MLRNQIAKLALSTAESILRNPEKSFSTAVAASKFIASGVASNLVTLPFPLTDYSAEGAKLAGVVVEALLQDSLDG